MAEKCNNNSEISEPNVFRLKVSNIPTDLEKDALESIFSDYGNVTGVQLIRQKKGSNLGYITYAKYNEAECAINALNNKLPMELRIEFQDLKDYQKNSQKINLSTPINDFRYKESHLDYRDSCKKIIDEKIKIPSDAESNNFSNDDPLLYEYPTDLTTFNPYESAGPHRCTNLMYTRGTLHINGENGRRHVAYGRGYTYYSLPDPNPNIGTYVKNVVERRERGLYEYMPEDYEEDKSGDCKICSTPTAFRCQQCEIAYYCSRDCQVQDWPKHKFECQQLPPLVRKISGKPVENNPLVPNNKINPEMVESDADKEKSISRENPKFKIPCKKNSETVTSLTNKTDSEKENHQTNFQSSENNKNITSHSSGNNFKALSTSFNGKQSIPNKENIQNQNVLQPKFNKPSLIINDDISFQTKESFLPRDKFVNVMITVAIGNGIYWVQKLDDLENIKKLFEKLESYAKTQQLIQPAENLKCVLEFEKSWYRATILSVTPSKVFFNDFGTIEDNVIFRVVSIDDFENMPYLSRKIRLTEDSDSELKSLEADNTILVKARSVQADGTIMVEAKKSIDDKIPVKQNEIILEKPANVPLNRPCGIIEKPTNKTIVALKIENTPNIMEKLKKGCDGMIVFQAAIGQKEFNVVIVPDDEFDNYAKLLDDKFSTACLNEIQNNPHFIPKMGQLVCGLNMQEEWYRGIVLCLSPVIKIAAIDDTRSFVPKKIVPIPKEFSELYSFGATCHFIEDHMEKVKSELTGQFKVIEVPETKDSVKIEITIEDLSIKGHALVKKWFPKPEQIGIKYAELMSDQDVVITEFVNQNLIYVYSNETEEAERTGLLKQKIAKFALDKKPLQEVPVIGQMVLALFKFDENYYRAVVKKVDGNKVTIVYVDYGNEEVTTLDMLYELSEELKVEPSCVAKIKLKDVPNEVPLTQEATLFLQQLTGNEVPLKCIFSGHPLIEGVTLITPRNENVNKSLIDFLTPSWQKTQENTKVYSLDDLPASPGLGGVGDEVQGLLLHYYEHDGSIIFGPNDPDLAKAVLADLPERIETYVASTKSHYIPRENELCIAKYDDSYYRAICLESSCRPDESRVFFIDYGNTERVKHEDLREFTEDLTSPGPFAILCNLSPMIPKEKYSSEVLNRIKDLAEVNELYIIKIVGMDEDGLSPMIDIPVIREKLTREGLL